ncbi:MAG: hypothetical protein AAFZ18_19370, partial [Myxococcota bacterium]
GRSAAGNIQRSRPIHGIGVTKDGIAFFWRAKRFQDRAFRDSDAVYRTRALDITRRGPPDAFES